jgi:site-specific DNA-cytosine methylase
LKPITVLSLFDGISCGQVVLDQRKIPIKNYFASEINTDAIKVTIKNYPNTIQLGDVNNWKKWVLPKIDILFGGSPCQGFSFSGKQLNFEDKRSSLFFKFVDIFKYLKEINPNLIFLFENVRMKKEYLDLISSYLEVTPIKINSSLVSAQNRVRYYWTNIENIKQPEDKGILLKDVLDLSYDGIYVVPRGYNKGGVQSYKGKCPTITTSSWQYNFLLYNGKTGLTRKVSPIEAERIQTLPENYTDCVSDNKRYKLIGNGWSIDTICHILQNIDI